MDLLISPTWKLVKMLNALELLNKIIGNKAMERFNNAKTAINESVLTMERQQKEGNLRKFYMSLIIFKVKYGFKLSGLPADVTDEEIEALFEEYKTHCKVVTMRNTENGTCRGHAWIDFTDLAIGNNNIQCSES